MLAQAKLLSWSSARARILNQLQNTSTIHENSPHLSRRISALSSRIPQFPLFSSRAITKFEFDTHLQAFTYYRSSDEDEYSTTVEDMMIASLYYDDPKDPHSAVFVYFASLTTGVIRRTLKYDFQFPSFQLLKYISKLKLIVGYSNNRLYLLSNDNGDLKYLTSIACPGVVRKIIYDKTLYDIIYVGGDKGLFVRWLLVQEKNGYDLRLGERLKSVFINRQHNIIDMKLDKITHQLFIIGHKGCLIFNTLLNRESASVLSAHGAPVTCANIYGYSIVMGFSDGVMKSFEIANDSVPVRYQFQAHQAAITSLLMTTDGIIISGATDGTVCFHSIDTLIKLGEHRFTESIERMMLVRGEDLLIKFKYTLQLLVYTLPIRSFSNALQSIEQTRVTFPVGSISPRVVLRSSQNLFTVHNTRSTQIINIIPLSPDRITINDFVYDSAAEILYIATNKTVCSYHCSSRPSYLLNVFEVKDECFFTKLCSIMWFSLLPEHTRKRRAFGVVLVGTTNGKLFLVPGDHELKYALLPDTSEALYSYFQVLDKSVTVDWLDVFQSYETYTTRRGARYLLAIGNDFIAKFYRLSISGHEIFLRQLGFSILLDAACIGTAMAQQRISIVCALRGYIQMFLITQNGLDEISPKDILHEHSPIKSVTGCDTLSLFATLNTQNEIMLWTINNQAVRKLKCDVPLIAIANLNDRGDILLVSNRKLHFLMMSDFAPEQVLYDLTTKTVRDDPIEFPVQLNKNFDKTLLETAQTIRLDEPKTTLVENQIDDSERLEILKMFEEEKAQAEMDKFLEKKKRCPIAPDGVIPNSILRSMFKIKEIEPVEVKMFQLRLDILENLQNKTNKNMNWQNDDDEWVELEDPEAQLGQPSSKPTSGKKSKTQRPTTGTLLSRQRDTIPDVFKRMRKEPWWKQTDEDENNNLRSMLIYLIEILKAKEKDSYESACRYIVEIFGSYGIEPTLVNQILDILLHHLSISSNDPLDLHTVRAIAQFMIERKNIIISLLDFVLKCQPENNLRQETINAIKFITDVNNSDDIDLILENMSVVRDADEDSFSLKTIIERIKYRIKSEQSDLNNKEEQDQEIETIHPLLKKISEERWFPRDNQPITLDLIIDAILAKLPNASKTMLKTLTSHLVQLHRVIGFTKEQFDRVSNGLISLLSHSDADYRLMTATILGDLGRETKLIDLALLNSFINDPRVLVRTECCDTLKKLTGITSETILTSCADDLPYLQTLPEENFSLKNYLNAKNGIDENQQQDEEIITPVNQDEEIVTPANQNEQTKSEIIQEDSTHIPLPTNEQIDDGMSFVHSRSPSPKIREQPTQDKIVSHEETPSQISMTPSLKSSTELLTPVEPLIRIEINEKSKSTIQTSENQRRSRKKTTSYSPVSRQSRQPIVPIEHHNRLPNKTSISDRSSGRRNLLLPNNSDMWDSYAKQKEMNEVNDSIHPTIDDIQKHQQRHQISDPIQTIIDDHKRHAGYFRTMPNRRVLIPHKITLGDIFGDESHMTVDRKHPLPSASTSMQLSDLNRNKQHLHEVEFAQLLSSLVIRSIQIHRQHDRFIPGSFSNSNSLDNFSDALTISQMQIHSVPNLQHSFYVPNRLPPISKRRPSSAEMNRVRADAQNRATKAGVNLQKAKDMEDAVSNILKSDRQLTRSTFVPANTPYPQDTTTNANTIDPNDVTHAWLLEQLLRSQGTTDAHHHIRQIRRANPKFGPLLHSRIPRSLISVIWDDPVLKQLASIISNKHDDSTIEEKAFQQYRRKTPMPTYDDEHSSNLFHYEAPSYILAKQQKQRDEQKNKVLPPIHATKIRLPRHVLKFGYREIDIDSPETSLESLRDETTTKSQRRRLYMHLMMSVNENIFARHELVKSQLRQMLKTDYRTATFMPTSPRSPMYAS